MMKFRVVFVAKSAFWMLVLLVSLATSFHLPHDRRYHPKLLLQLKQHRKEQHSPLSPVSAHAASPLFLSTGVGEEVDDSSSSADTVLPPGRPTSRWIRWFYDDTVRLLNPKDMKLLERKHKYGPIFKTNFLFRPTVFLTDSDSIKDVAKVEGKATNTPTFQAFFPPHHMKLFGPNSLLVVSGDKHTRLRNLMMPHLSSAALDSYRPLIQQGMMEFFEENSQQGIQPLVPKIRSLFTSIMLQVVLGTQDVSKDLVDDIEIWSRGLLAPPLTAIPWSTAGKAMNARKRIVAKLVDLMDQPQELNKQGLLAKLLTARDDSNNALTQEEIIDNIFTLVFAGSDTTSAAAASVCIVLGQNPDLFKSLRENSKDGGDEFLLQTFVTQILESFPSAPFQMREITESIQVGEYTVPANWLVAYGYAAALEESLAPSVDSLMISQKEGSDGGVATGPPSSIAFGQGPRKCPGRYLATCELIEFTKTLLHDGYGIELEPKQNLEQRYTPGFFPVDGLKARIIKS